MRPAGFTLAALLVGVSVAWAQPPGTPGVPPVAPPIAPPVGAAANLDTHLQGWEKTMGDVKNFRVELALTRKDAVFQKTKEYSGVVLCMKPNFAVLRLDYVGDTTKTDYEAFICNGKAVYAYNGNMRTITEHKLPNPALNPGGGTNNLMLDFLSGLKAKDAKQRFDLTLFKEDANYVYLDVKPVLGADKQEFQQVRLALYGPNTKFAYLPAQVYKVNPSGDSESWSFKNPQTNLPGVDEKAFQFVDVKGFRFEQAPPPAPPGGLRPAPGLPAGPGAMRP